MPFPLQNNGIVFDYNNISFEEDQPVVAGDRISFENLNEIDSKSA